MSPTPFSLNDSDAEGENDSHDKSYDSFDDDEELDKSIYFKMMIKIILLVIY